MGGRSATGSAAHPASASPQPGEKTRRSTRAPPHEPGAPAPCWRSTSSMITWFRWSTSAWRSRPAVVPDELAHARRARRHHDERRADRHRLLDRVSDEHDGLARLRPDPLDLRLHDPAVLGVQRAERLVHEQEGRLDRERPGDGRALPHPAGDPVGIVALEARQTHEAEVPVGGVPARGLVEALGLQHEGDVVGQRHPRQQPVLLEHHAHVQVAVAAVGDRAPVEPHLARRRRLEAAEDPEERRLAAPVRAEQAHELALLGLQRDGVEDGDGVPLGDLVNVEPHRELHRTVPVEPRRAFGAPPGRPAQRQRSSRRVSESNTSLSVTSMMATMTSAHTNTIWVARISRL